MTASSLMVNDRVHEERKSRPICILVIGDGPGSSPFVGASHLFDTQVNALDSPEGIAVDGAGNVYVAGVNSENAFQIEPDGTITEIIDTTGDGAGNTLSSQCRS